MSVIVLKPKKKIVVKGSICVTQKLRENDAINITNLKKGIIQQGVVVSDLMKNDPVRLWKLLYTKGSGIKLVGTEHKKLKAIISKIAPELIEEVNAKRLRKAVERKFAQEKSENKLGTSKSSFRGKN